jgi:hypothetical protein
LIGKNHVPFPGAFKYELISVYYIIHENRRGTRFMKSLKLPLIIVAAIFLLVALGLSIMTKNVKNQDMQHYQIENPDITKKEHSDSNIADSVEKEKSIRLDPYHKSIWEHFNPEQIDFSKEYLELGGKELKNAILQFIGYDFSSIWLTGDINSRNGVLGQNYQRIQIHISKITRSLTDSAVYLAEGKSKVNNNICNFKGEIKPIRLFFYECDIPPDSTSKCADLKAAYTFYEDSTEKHSGMFTGIVGSSVFVDSIKKTISLDETFEDADGYFNNTFVGIWTSYKTKQSKKCIWGDYRLPFTRGFDCGDGGMMVCSEYVKNGWQTFNDGSEFTEVDNDKWERKDKWWKK